MEEEKHLYELYRHRSLSNKTSSKTNLYSLFSFFGGREQLKNGKPSLAGLWKKAKGNYHVKKTPGEKVKGNEPAKVTSIRSTVSSLHANKKSIDFEEDSIV